MKVYIKPLHKVKNLKIDEPAQNQVDLVEKIIKWGDDDNNMPYFITTTVQRSVTAQSCSRTYLQYLYGNGFNDKEVARVLDSQLYIAAQQYRTFRMFALKVYLQAGTMNIAKVESIPVEHLRFTVPNKEGEINTVKYNQFFGSSYDYRTYKSKTFPLFDADKSKRYELALKYPNTPFILIHSDMEAFSSPYPLPDYWGDNSSHGGGYESMIADYALGKLLTKELFDGFMQNVILNMVGNPDEPITEHESLAADGKAYTTKGDAFQRKIDESFKGLDGASMMILWSQIKDQFPEVKAFPSSFNYDKLQGVVDTVRTQVATAWNVPSILANIATSGTLSKDDITSAVRLMWGVVRRKQLTLERTFQLIVDELAASTQPQLIGKKAVIENYSPFPIKDMLDDKVWEVLTTDEKRKWVADNTNVELVVNPTQTDANGLPVTAANDILTNLTGKQLQGIQRIVRKFNKGELTYDQAALMLKNGFGFNDIDVDAWLVTQEEA